MFQKAISIAIFTLAAGFVFAVSAQEAPTVNTPAVPDNAQPLSDNIKLRSVELDRIKREAEKTAVLRRENGKELNFSLIKDDFEGIQKEQADIIQAYTSGEKINYPKISSSANEITEMAVRLRGNVFESAQEASEKNEGAEDENPYIGRSVRDLIVELDNSIGEVVVDPMWQKLAVIDPEVSRRGEASLVKVIKASNALWIEARKMEGK